MVVQGQIYGVTLAVWLASRWSWLSSSAFQFLSMNGPSATPVKEFLESIAWPAISVDHRYLVLPRVVLEHLPLSFTVRPETAGASLHDGPNYCGTLLLYETSEARCKIGR